MFLLFSDLSGLSCVPLCFLGSLLGALWVGSAWLPIVLSLRVFDENLLLVYRLFDKLVSRTKRNNANEDPIENWRNEVSEE